MDRMGSIILVAGLGCFAFAFLLSGIYPWAITDAKVPTATLEQLAEDVPIEFRDLKDAYPVSFRERFPRADEAHTSRELAGQPDLDVGEDAWRENYAQALRDGRDLYISEVCWHCHSQYVRPVANEAQRFGPVQLADHDNNELQRPQLWGTRRVGPDLTHEGRKRSNDWHVAHFWNPDDVSPGTVMPRYRWLFREGWEVRRQIDPGKADRGRLSEDRSYPYPGLWPTRAEAEQALETIRANLPSSLAADSERLFVAEAAGPNGEALSLIAYLQWLGTWTPPHLLEDA
jgi:cytochrome c oxidase cbb3-type subunit 2